MSRTPGSGDQSNGGQEQPRRDRRVIYELVGQLLGAALFLGFAYWDWSDGGSLIWTRLLSDWVPLLVASVFLVLAAQSFIALLTR